MFDLNLNNYNNCHVQFTVSSLKGTTPYPFPPKIKISAPGMTDANGAFHQGLRGFLCFFPVTDGWYTSEN